MGLKEIINKAGGALLSGACCGLLFGEMPEGSNVIATDAAKQDYYITGIVYPRKLQVRYGTTEDCVQAALSGKWKAEWR